MAGLKQMREVMAEYLRGKGLAVVTAWPGTARSGMTGPVVALSLRACESTSAGFRDYLGERYNQGKKTWEELYGKALTLTLGLDIYCPKALGEGGCLAAFDLLTEALDSGNPGGLNIRALSRGEVQYRPEAGLLLCPAEVCCSAYLYAIANEGGEFVDFEIKGVSV